MGLQLSRNMNQADPIIIVGLGGLGGGVIDSLKGKIKNDYDDINRVEMRIADIRLLEFGERGDDWGLCWSCEWYFMY